MGECFLRGFIKEKIFRGIRQRVEIEAMNPNAERQRLKFDFSSHDILPEIGDEIVLSFDPLKAIQFFQF
jgi:hypothetical protein